MQTSLSIVGDPSLSRGDIRIDCSAGWIEHGTSLYLDALRSELGLDRPRFLTHRVPVRARGLFDLAAPESRGGLIRNTHR